MANGLLGSAGGATGQTDENKWVNLSFDIGPIKPAATFIKTITDAVTLALKIQKTATDIVAKLAVDFLDAEALIIKTALSSIRSVIDDYTAGDAKVHVLVVPPQRRLQYNLDTELMMPQLEDSWAISDAFTDEQKARFQTVLQTVGRYDRGNEGFARTVIESLSDEFDPNRPTYENNDAVFALVVLVGARDMLGLYDLMRTLQGIFSVGLRENLFPADLLKTPQDLKATPIAAPGETRIGIRLEWGNPPAEQVLEKYGGARVQLHEIAIIRSTDDETMLARNWDDVFGGWQPTVLDQDNDEREKKDVYSYKTGSHGEPDAEVEVIRIFAYEGVRHSYIDTDSDLKKGQDYYYFVAYRYALAEEPSDKSAEIKLQPQDFSVISNVVKARISPDKVPDTRLSVPPNWHATPDILALIPSLKFFMALIEDFIANLESQLVGSASALKQFIEFLQAEIDRYNAFATAMNAQLAKLALLLQVPSAGIYVTLISAEKGGNNYFMQELVDRLTNENDATAPPFFRNGFTAGMVAYAGARNPSDIVPVETILSILLGLESEATTAWEAAVDEIDNLVEQLEALEFGEDMEPGTAPDAASPQQTFDDNMNPVPASDPNANIPFDP
jgi:hypothetical protein